MAQKYLILPQDLMSKLTHTTAIPSTVSTLDEMMRTILQRDDLTDYDKWKMYSQALQRYTYIQGQLRKPVKLNFEEEYASTISPKKIETDVINSLPSTLQKKGKQLLDFIKETSDISWTEKGDVVIDQKIMDGSHLRDLVTDVLHTKRSKSKPTALKEFVSALKRNNVSTALIPKRKISKFVWEE